jgi:hypothetical protein
MIFGKWISMSLSVAARLRIADLLAESPLSIDELSAATKTHPQSLYRLMRALASVGVFRTNARAQFELTEVGYFLRSNVKGSMRGVADYCGAMWSWRAWEEMLFSIQTGDTAFDKVFQQPVFDYLSQHPEESAVFNEGMTGFSGSESEAIIEVYDFSRFSSIVDIGGGHGHLLASILRKFTGAKGTVFDAPHVVTGAMATFHEFGVADRANATGGDFFHSVPSGHDAYLLKHIIHDWNDTNCQRILKAIRSACTSGTTLLVCEMVIPSGDQPHPGKLLDLEMLVVASGQERTESEYQSLLASRGFRLERIVALPSPISIVEAVAV